jgi:hypothetical protein
MAIFVNARPFTLFDNPFLLGFPSAMKQGYYRIPYRSTVGGSLLSQCYSMVQKKMDDLIGRLKYINLSADETTNTGGQRVVNLSVSTPDRSSVLLHRFGRCEGRTAHATNIASWIVDKIKHSWSVLQCGMR